MKVNIIRKGVAAILAFLMMWSVAFGATISNLKFKKDTVSFDYYVSGDNATVWAYDTANPSNVLYIDQEEADGSFSFGLPDGFEGEQVTVRVGGSNEPVAQETVYVTPTPAPTPDPESVEAGGIYAYVNKEDFTTMSINYDEKYIVTDADFKEEANANAYAAGAEGIIVYEEYSGAEGVFYVDGHSLGSPYFKYSFDPIKSGKAKFTVRFMHSTYPQAGSDGEVFFFSILDGTNSEFAIRNCTAQYTSNTVPVSGMYFWNGNDDYTRFRSAGADATWQTLTYLVDMDKKSFEVEYNGESVGTGSFYSSNVTELSQIYFTGGRKQWQGNYYLDEIKVLAETADEYETHTVTFHGEDGGVLETKEIKAGRRMIPVDAPSKRDHTFIEWTLRDGSPADFTSITSDMDVYAKYLPRCTVEFYNQEGTEKLATTTVDYGTEAKIVAPKIDGYTFMGWRTTDGVAVDLKSITASYTLYAWYEKQPTVYYYDLDAFGNASLYRTQTIDYATDAEIIVAPTSRQDKKFIAWGTADGVVADLSNVRGDRKVYAIYGTQDSTAMEDFENISFKEDGTVTTESENPLKEIIIPSQTFTAYTSNSGATETYNTILDSGTYTVWRNNNANGNYEASSTFTLDSKAIMMKVGQYPTFKFEEASSGVVKVSYDILTVERRRGNGTDSAIMGIYDSATRNYAVKVGDIAYNAEGKKQNAWYAYDGATSQTMCDAKYNTWQKMEYYIDLDNSEYVVKLGGTVYGPYAFRNTVNKVDAITSNVTQHLGMYVMDNLEVETLSVAPKAELIGNDGSSLGMVALSAGTDANPPVAPEIKGKKFAGWYEDAEGTKKVTFAAFTGDKVYAKYLDKVLVETFDTTTIDYTTGKLTGSAFDVQFGLNANNLPEEANAAIKTPSGRDSNALYVDIASKQHATKIVYSFPEVSEGVVKVSFDINIVEWLNTGDGPVDIGSLITGTAASHKTAARLIGAQNNWKLFTNDDEENLVDIGMSGGNHWNTVTYYADLDNQTYKVQVGDTISGPYNFKNTVDSVDGIYFGDVRTGWQGQYYLDNLTVDTDYHDPVVTFNNADGTKIADVTVVNGKVTVPSYTVPAGKSFIGWSDGTNIVTKFDEIEEDMTLTMSVKDAVALRETFDSFRTDLIADAESATGQIVAADGTTITDNALTSGYTLNGYAYKKSHFFVQADGNDNVLGINNDGSLNYDALKFAFAPIKGENKANISFDYKLSSVYNAFSVNNNYDNKYGMAIVKGKDTNGNEKIAALIQYTNTGYLTDAEGNVLNEGMGLVVFKNNGDGQINAEDWVTIVPYTGTPSDGWDWNNLELVFDVKAQTFDVLLNGTNKGTFPFKDTVDNVSVVEFNMSHAGHFGRNASLFVDDVTVVENKSEVFNPFPNEEPTPVSILAYANGKLVVNSPSDGKLYIVTKAANGEVSTAAVHTVTANTEADFNFATGETAYLWSAVMDPICDPFTISQ